MMSPVDRRYARALLRMQKNSNEAAQASAKQAKFVAGLFSIPEASKILLSPVMPEDLKIALLEYALKLADADAGLKSFVHYIVRAGRTDRLPHIFEAFQNQVDESAKISRVECITAVSLEEKELATVKQDLSHSKMFSGRTLEVLGRVDPALLGGLIVKVGNARVDLSFKSKLDALSLR